MGSIPACAGEPRRERAGKQGQGLGLSPRVRGNRIGLDFVPLIEGSIPACAGEPFRRSSPKTNPSSGSIPACAGEPLVDKSLII